MKTKFIGGSFLLVGLVSALFGVTKLVPVIWAWMVKTGNEIAMTGIEMFNEFVAFQNAEPVAAGLVALTLGAVFAVIGFFMVRENNAPSKGGGFSFGRSDREANQWEEEVGVVKST